MCPASPTWAAARAIGPTFTTLAQTAEAIGVRTLSVMDHWFQMEMMWPADEPMLEGYTTLSFAAAKTERLRFRMLVGGVTYRHPGLLAKTITTLDVLSGGRAELGLGAAWYEREHLGLGVPFPPLSERYERLEETLQICFQMWSDDNGPYQGRHYQLAETLCSPQPVSSPRPQVLIGGGGERKTLRLVARYADACNIIGDVETVAHKVGVLRAPLRTTSVATLADIEVTALDRGGVDDASPDDILREAAALQWGGRRGHRHPGSRPGAVPVARGALGTRAAEAGCEWLNLPASTPRRTPLRQLSCRRGPLAHPEEQGTFNPKVPGSRPGRPTRQSAEALELKIPSMNSSGRTTSMQIQSQPLAPTGRSLSAKSQIVGQGSPDSGQAFAGKPNIDAKADGRSHR